MVDGYSRFGAFIRAVLPLAVPGILTIVVFAFIPILGWFAIMAGWIMLLVFVVMGFIAAVSGEQKPLPLLGDHYQKWFANAFT